MLRIRLPLPRFFGAEDVFFGKKSIGVLRALDAARVLVVTSPSIERDQDTVNAIRKSLGDVSTNFLCLKSGEQSLNDILSVQDQVTEFAPDWIVAVGGGSVIDASKMIWSFYEHPGLDLERAAIPETLPTLRSKAKFAAIPTTCGTGSEISSVSVFLDAEGRKQFVISRQFIPDLVILDPTVSANLPRQMIASTAFDALSHAIEGYLSKVANPFVDNFAEQAVSRIFEFLVPACEDTSNLDARLELMMSAFLAGIVQNFKTPGLGHAVAHQLGAVGLGHGEACALMLEHAIEFNSSEKTVKEKIERLEHRLSIKTGSLKSKLCSLMEVSGLRRDLDCKIATHAQDFKDKEELIVKGALADPCAKTNARIIDAEDVRNILVKILN